MKRNPFFGAWRSIRTQSAIATVLFLVLILTAFYIGGRIVVLHLVREAEEQVEGERIFAQSQNPTRQAMALSKICTQPSNSNSPTTLADTALDYYTGGFWNFEGTVPSGLAGLTRVAMMRLALFVGVGGILLVVLIFFVQSRVVLDPLSRMTKLVGEIGQNGDPADCPRLDWKGQDEFAQLALSVNRMLETISERSLAVAQAESRHRELINSLPDELLVFGADGRFVSILKASESNCQLPGLFPGEPLSEGVYGRTSVLRFNAAVGNALRTGRVGKLAMQVHERHFEMRIVRMDPHFALAMVSDMTDDMRERERLHQAEQRLADAEKRESLTRLAASISHDMNNILSVVLNAAESDAADPSGDSAETLSAIRDAVRRGEGMMRELKTYAGETSVSLVRVPAHIVVDDIRPLAEQLFPKTIMLAYDKAADAPDVDADPDQFWKVIFNIAKNAGEAIGKNRPGRIIIGCARMTMTAEDAAKFISEKPLPPGVGTVFTVRDDGPGIAPDILPRLFDPYVSSKSVGRGLGLATVRTIIEAHGGGIRVTSRPGVGSLFEIYLPASRKEIQVEVEKVGGGVGGGGQRRDNNSTVHLLSPPPPTLSEILLIDDDDLILRTTSILLKSIGIKPHTAKDNAEALAIVRRYAKELGAIILDADLGGVDSVRLLGSIRASASNVPVIVSTGSAEEQVRDLFATCPYDDFLSKPYTLIELKAALARVTTSA